MDGVPQDDEDQEDDDDNPEELQALTPARLRARDANVAALSTMLMESEDEDGDGDGDGDGDVDDEDDGDGDDAEFQGFSGFGDAFAAGDDSDMSESELALQESLKAHVQSKKQKSAAAGSKYTKQAPAGKASGSNASKQSAVEIAAGPAVKGKRKTSAGASSAVAVPTGKATTDRAKKPRLDAPALATTPSVPPEAGSIRKRGAKPAAADAPAPVSASAGHKSQRRSGPAVPAMQAAAAADDEVKQADSDADEPDPLNFSQIPVNALHDKSKKTQQRIAKEFPLYSEVQGQQVQCEVKQGEMLYLPASWFHEVTSYGAQEGTGHMAFNYWVHPPDGSSFEHPYADPFWQEEWTSRWLPHIQAKVKLYQQ